MLANYVHDATDLQKMKCSTSYNHVIPLVPPVSLFFSLSMIQGRLDWQTRDDVCISKSIIRKAGKLLAPLSHNLEMRSTIRAELSLALVSDVKSVHRRSVLLNIPRARHLLLISIALRCQMYSRI